MLVALLAAIGPVREAVLRSLGSVLVAHEAPCKADAIAVLAGDQNGRRILKAGELAEQGYAPVVLVSGPGLWYGINESDLAIDFAVKNGLRRNLFVAVHQKAFSTVEEAKKTILPAARMMGAHTLLVVTSEFHTARSARIYRREAPDLKICVAASDTYFWDHGRWWSNREGQKIWLTEMAKTIADRFRI
jgi:uncharacterized SAM-binding protein YcdF (DUF218 family)